MILIFTSEIEIIYRTILHFSFLGFSPFLKAIF